MIIVALDVYVYRPVIMALYLQSSNNSNSQHCCLAFFFFFSHKNTLF
jgi:hypothetical protein